MHMIFWNTLQDNDLDFNVVFFRHERLTVIGKYNYVKNSTV